MTPARSSREEILARIRTALADRPAPVPIPRDYRRGLRAGGSPEQTDLFIERVADYNATVHRCGNDDIAGTLSAILADRGIARIVIAQGFPPDWSPAIDTVSEPVSIASLDEIGAVLTTSAVAIAETGTIVLDAGPGQGQRALTLIPDYHLVLVDARRIRAIVPDALAALDPTRPLTWISGPSATVDIELKRVQGVHGPRTLDVLVVG